MTRVQKWTEIDFVKVDNDSSCSKKGNRDLEMWLDIWSSIDFYHFIFQFFPYLVSQYSWRNRRTAYWVIFIVNIKRSDRRKYNLCLFVTVKTNWAEFFKRLFCYSKWISSKNIVKFSLQTKFMINNRRDWWIEPICIT